MADLISTASADYLTTGSSTTATSTAGTSDRNTLSIESYFKLLAAQLANQDMTNPMDNSELMGQMTQMAQIQSLAQVNSAIQDNMNLSRAGYMASMIGRQVTVRVDSAGESGEGASSEEYRTGVVESIDFSGEEPRLTLQGSQESFSMDSIRLISRAGTSAAQEV